MTHLLEQVGGWIEELVIAAIGYPGIVAVMAIENIFPPIPSEAVLPFAGAIWRPTAILFPPDFWGVVAAGTAGSVLGAYLSRAVRRPRVFGGTWRNKGRGGGAAAGGGVRAVLFLAWGRSSPSTTWTAPARGGEWRGGSSGTARRSSSSGGSSPSSGAWCRSRQRGYTRMNPVRFLLYTTLGTELALWSLLLTYAGMGAGRELGDDPRVHGTSFRRTRTRRWRSSCRDGGGVPSCFVGWRTRRCGGGGGGSSPSTTWTAASGTARGHLLRADHEHGRALPLYTRGVESRCAGRELGDDPRAGPYENAALAAIVRDGH